MKVLLAAEHFYPSTGGVEVYLMQLGQQLAQRGWEVHVATRPHPARQTRELHGMRIYEFDIGHQTQSGVVATEVPRFFEHLLVQRYDAVFVLGAIVNPWVLLLAQVPQPKPRLVAAVVLNREVLQLVQQQRGEAQAVQVLRGFDAVLALTERGVDAQFYASHGIPAVFVPHAVDAAPRERPLREWLGVPAHELLVVHVANFYAEKGHAALIEAMQQHRVPCTLAMIGRPAVPCPQEFASAIAAAERDSRLRVIGELPSSLAAQAIASADLLVLPSRAECAPITILQAMAAGVPWLATPNCNSVLRQAGGLVLEVAEFPAAMELLGTRSALRQALGALGFEHWRAAHSWDATLPMLVQVLQGAQPNRSLAIPPTLLAKQQNLVRACSGAGLKSVVMPS